MKVRAIYSVSPVMVFGSFCTPEQHPVRSPYSLFPGLQCPLMTR